MNTFYFDIKKAVQLAASFLSKEPSNSMYYVKLLKLMYLADRENIIQSAYPVTGDALVALKRGPVLSEILYYMAREKHSDDWSRHFNVSEDNKIKLTQDPGKGLLSRSINAITDRLFEQFKDYTVNEIVKYTHDLPEWRKTKLSGSRDIDVRDILIDAELSEENIAAILAHIKETTDALCSLENCEGGI